MTIIRKFLRPGTSFLTVLVHNKIPSSTIHILHSFRPNRLHQFGLFEAPNHIISRYESSQTITSKDKILNLVDNETKTSTSEFITKNSSDNILPEIQNPEDINALSDIPEIIREAVVPLNKLGEPTLQSIGLGSYFTPVGWIQNTLEFFHCTFEIPWWNSIIITVVIARLLMFPIIIKTQRNSVKMTNLMPELMKMQDRMTQARIYGNTLEVLQSSHDMSKFVRDNKFNPFKSTLLPFFQAPVFISFFFGIRKMCKAPVESFTQGGTLWFVDLTSPDQMYLLPAITCVSLYATLQTGSDFGKLSVTGNFRKYAEIAIKVLPVAVFFLSLRFPSGICLYWAVTNIFSLIQVLFLKIPAVRKYFNIEATIKHKLSNQQPKTSKGFVKDLKHSFGNMKISKQIAEREKLDEMNFKRAGKLPPAKTFKHNPLLMNPSSVQAQKK